MARSTPDHPADRDSTRDPDPDVEPDVTTQAQPARPEESDASPDAQPHEPRELSETAQAELAKLGTGRRRLNWWQESVLLVVFALIVAVVLKSFFLQSFSVPSETMEPGLQAGDRVLVEKPSYWGGGSPQRGDIVVFSTPPSWQNVGGLDQGNGFTSFLAGLGLYASGDHLIGRVIGVAGDTISCCDATNGDISVNGVPIDEDDYVLDEQNVPCRGPMTGNCSWTAGPVPAGQVFVMQDNRFHATDSTVQLCTAQEATCTESPYVPDDLIVGKLWRTFWPLSAFGGVPGTDAFEDEPDPK